jgi:citrate lyase subunit beta/citryl-CoA lyase
MNTPITVRRSLLYAAPMHEASIAGGLAAPADILCLDLEDSTPPAVKVEARRVIADALGKGRPKARATMLRVNGLDTAWGYEDLRFAAGLGIDHVLIPKVEGDGTVRQALQILCETNERPPALWCLIETPLGVLRAERIASAGIAGIVVGGGDLIEGLGAKHTMTRAPLWHALSQILLVARAYGLTAIDSIHPRFDDPAGFEISCQQAAELGFDGKSIFQPTDIALVNRLFAPNEEEVAQARKALTGAGGYGGHQAHARRVIAFHEMATEIA